MPTAGTCWHSPALPAVCPWACPHAQLLLQPNAGAGVGQGGPNSPRGGVFLAAGLGGSK